MLADMLGGRVDFTVDLGTAIVHLKSGALRLLAVPGKARSPLFPDTPTLIEHGTNVELVWISGVYAPAGTPRAIVERLNREIARAMQAPESKTHLDAMAAEGVPPMTPAPFATHQQRAGDRFGDVVRQAGIKANWDEGKAWQSAALVSSASAALQPHPDARQAAIAYSVAAGRCAAIPRCQRR